MITQLFCFTGYRIHDVEIHGDLPCQYTLVQLFGMLGVVEIKISFTNEGSIVCADDEGATLGVPHRLGCARCHIDLYVWHYGLWLVWLVGLAGWFVWLVCLACFRLVYAMALVSLLVVSLFVSEFSSGFWLLVDLWLFFLVRCSLVLFLGCCRRDLPLYRIIRVIGR